jgi:hypothetical protein
MATKKTAASRRVSNDVKITVVKKENPFVDGTHRAKMAKYVLTHNGKTYGELKDASKGLVDSWIIRQLADRKLIKVRTAA